MSVTIVGAGLAGLRTAEALRLHGYAEPITLAGAERHAPYSRPPLSKEVLRGDADLTVATLRSATDLAALDLDLRLGATAVGLDVATRTVSLTDGTTLPGDHVVIATGASPRRLPGVTPAGVHVLRTADDCLTLRDALGAGVRVVVIGAGFIGLEVAASARSRGAEVTVVDVLPAPLARVLPPAVGGAVAALHESHGVSVRCGVGVAGAHGTDRVESVELADGTSLAADVVVVGIGVVPETGWLAGSGLTLDDGVGCDETLAAAPGIWAVGDVARWRSPDGPLRMEHWTNATEQPQAVARSIATGSAEPFATVPYFWSDQYDAKLQSLGSDLIGDEVRLVHGSFEEPKWVALVRSGDRLSGVVGMRSAGRVMKVRPLLAARASWHDALDATAAG